jgi:hypothetical protein
MGSKLLVAALAALVVAGCGADDGREAQAPVQREPTYSVEQTLAAFEQARLPLDVRVRDGECLDPPAPEPGMDQIASGCFVFRKDGSEPDTLTAFLVPHEDGSGAAPNLMSVTVYASAAAAREESARLDTLPLAETRRTFVTRIRANVVAGCFRCTDADVERIERALAAL